MLSFANTGSADFQFQYTFIITKINKSNFFVPLPRRVWFVLCLIKILYNGLMSPFPGVRQNSW